MNIPIAQSPEPCQILAQGMSDVHVPTEAEKLQAIVAKMRELGVTEYAGIKLGPEPVQNSDTDQPSGPSAEDRVKAERAKRLRIASLASGGPVPRVGPK